MSSRRSENHGTLQRSQQECEISRSVIVHHNVNVLYEGSDGFDIRGGDKLRTQASGSVSGLRLNACPEPWEGLGV